MPRYSKTLNLVNIKVNAVQQRQHPPQHLQRVGKIGGEARHLKRAQVSHFIAVPTS